MRAVQIFMSKKSKTLVLVDGSSYLYRAFHALPALKNSKGFPTGAIYGMVNMLKRLMADVNPEYMAVVFDAKGKTFRSDLYEDYKATRSEMPDDLIRQIEPIHRIIRALGLPLIAVEGVEADDVIATLATHATQNDMLSLISTSDKDLAQLVDEHVTLINTMTNVKLDIEGVEKKFGVLPSVMVDYLTLVGDTSDNIKGVPKVGPKTAAKWLAEYGNLDNIVANAHAFPGKIGENLRNFIPQIPLTKSLVTIKRDINLPIDYYDLQIKPADKKNLIELYKDLEFRNWLAELLDEINAEKPASCAQYILITTEKILDDWIQKINQTEFFAFDLVTDNDDYLKANLVGIGLALSPKEAAYIPFGHNYSNALQQLSKPLVLNKLKPILENSDIKKVAQNIKYYLEIFANDNILLSGHLFCTMLESYVLDSISNAHDLDSLSLKYLGLRTITQTEIVGKGSKQISFNLIDVEKTKEFAAQNADICLRLHSMLWPRIESLPGLKRIFEEIEMPLVPILANMERYGVLIDPKKLKEQGKELEKRLAKLEQEAYRLAGKKFNINSPKQLQEILFEILKLPILQKTPTGQPSTADQVLQELSIEFALPHVIIEYRSLTKLISTYTNRLVEQISPETGRIHTSYNQTATATGRLSSSDPNLQNIPIRTANGRRIRQTFVAPYGYKIVSADYSQIELRLMAQLSHDENLVKAFQQDIDIHKATAAEVWQIPIDEVTAEMRRNAKAINFGLIYGMSAFGLHRQLSIDRSAAQAYIDLYFARYPRVKAYMDSTRLKAKEKGYVETLWGRRLYVPDINASQITRQRAAERMAINAPLQGSAADIIKLAMIHIDHWLRSENVPAKMIMQVHDELVFEVDETQVEMITKTIRQLMTGVIKLEIPLQVAIGIGDNWDAASAH